MIFKRLTVENLGPFLGSWEVTLGEGVTAFVGEYEGAGERSNRAGKSWLAVDVPLYVLFGVLRGGRVEDLPHRLARGREDAWAEVEVESSDGRTWVLRRGRTAGGEPIRTLAGVAVSERDLEAAVRDEVVGLSAEEFLLTAASVQGELPAFLRLSSAEKRRVLAPWFRTDRWVPRADLARRRMLRAQATLRALDEREGRLRGILENGTGRADAVEQAQIEVAQLRGSVEGLIREEAARRERDRVRREAAGEVRRLEAEAEEERRGAFRALEEARAAAGEAEAVLAAAADREERVRHLEAREAALGELHAAVNEARNALNLARDGLRVEVRAREELLARYRALREERTGVCPVLRESCDRVAPNEGILEEIRREGLGHRRREMALSAEIDAAGWKLDMTQADAHLAEEEVRELRALRADVTSAQAEADLRSRRREATDAERAVERCRTGRTEVGRALLRARKVLLDAPEDDGVTSAELTDARAALRFAEDHLLVARAAAAELERAEEDVRGLGVEREKFRRELELTAWAAYAFGAAGIPSRELENAFGSAEVNMNRVLEALRTSLRVRFSPTRELRDWEPACVGCGTPFERGERTHACRLCGAARRRKRRDELRLEVLDGEHETSWDVDSGGGKVFLSLGVRLGLVALPGERRRVRCETLILDEPDGALDEPNRAALHAMLNSGLTDLGVRQVLLITHADVRREFRNLVTVHRWGDEDRSGAWNEGGGA